MNPKSKGAGVGNAVAAISEGNQKLKAVLRERLAELNADKRPITAFLGDDYCNAAYAAAEATRANSCFLCAVRLECGEFMTLRSEDRQKLKEWLEVKLHE